MTTDLHDRLGRVVAQINPLPPHVVSAHDRLGRTVATAMYSSAAGLTAETDPKSATTNRLSLSETFHDTRGRVGETVRWKINPSDGSEGIHWSLKRGSTAAGRTVKTQGEHP